MLKIIWIFFAVVSVTIQSFGQEQSNSETADSKILLSQLRKEITKRFSFAQGAGDYSKVYRFIDSVVHENPLNAYVYIPAFKKLIDIDPDKAYLFGWRVLHTGPWQSGNEAFLYRLGVEASSRSGLETRTRELDFDLAIECFKRVIEITENPANIPINYKLMAGAYFFKGDTKMGEEMMMKAIESLPDDAAEAEKANYRHQLKVFKEKYGKG